MEENELKLGVINCVTNSWKLLFKNFWKFVVAFLYPILGTGIGMTFITFSVIFISKNPANKSGVILSSIFIILGAALFCHALWRYFIRVGATNLVVKSLIINNEFIDYKEQNKIVQSRWVQYLLLALLTTIICFTPILLGLSISLFFKHEIANILAVIVFLVAFYLAISLSLSVPFFIFNEELSISNCVKSSMNLINKNFLPTIGMMLFYMITLIPLVVIFKIPYVGEIIRFIFNFVNPALGVLIIVHWYLKLTSEEKPV